jgi:hypothetical protein
MTPSVPIEVVHGADEVTVWMWSDSPDSVTVRFSYHEWARVGRKAERVADGDVGKVLGTLLADDLGGG